MSSPFEALGCALGRPDPEGGEDDQDQQTTVLRLQHRLVSFSPLCSSGTIGTALGAAGVLLACVLEQIVRLASTGRSTSNHAAVDIMGGCNQSGRSELHLPNRLKSRLMY
jgi:hypothetical protein